MASIGALPRRGGDHARRGGGPAAHGIQKGELTLGSDNGSALTARRFKARLAEQGIRHRRGGYRDPESQAFIESWFGKLKERELWLNDYETLDQAAVVSQATSRATTTAPTRGSTTGRPTRCAGDGKINNNYKNKRPNPSTPTGRTSPTDYWMLSADLGGSPLSWEVPA